MIFIVLIAAVLIVAVLWSGPAPLQGEGGINTLEAVRLGGVKQWISIRGQDRHAPLLLFLHGGPGSANLAKLRLQVPELEKHFVVVNWDQRAAGKSFNPGLDSATLTRAQMISDAHELVQILKNRFGVKQVYLLGFSWGTVLGLSLADRYPEDIAAFISVSQEVNYREGEKESLAFVRQAAQAANNTQAAAELAGIDPAYSGPDGFAQLGIERKWLLTYRGVYHNASSYMHEIWMLLKAPEYSFVDVIFWVLGSNQSLKVMWPELMRINFFDEVKTLRCPVYFFVGRYDYNSPWRLTEQYYQQLQAPAGKKWVWFEQSAHDLFFDQPDQLTRAVLDVLNSDSPQ